MCDIFLIIMGIRTEGTDRPTMLKCKIINGIFNLIYLILGQNVLSMQLSFKSEDSICL